MKKWIKILLILFVVGIISAFLVYKFYINKPFPDFEKVKADYKLKAEFLYNEYINNKSNADTKYNGKVIEISGNISKTELSDSSAIAIFVFKQGDFGDEGIRCSMLPKYIDEIKNISSENIVKIKGVCSGYNDTDVIIEKSSLIR